MHSSLTIVLWHAFVFYCPFTLNGLLRSDEMLKMLTYLDGGTCEEQGLHYIALRWTSEADPDAQYYSLLTRLPDSQIVLEFVAQSVAALGDARAGLPRCTPSLSLQTRMDGSTIASAQR